MTQMMTLNEDAVLVELDNSEIYVLFEGKHYSRDEEVPPHIYAPRVLATRIRAATTAREFVAVCMAKKYDSAGDWPALARTFLGLDVRREKSSRLWTGR